VKPRSHARVWVHVERAERAGGAERAGPAERAPGTRPLPHARLRVRAAAEATEAATMFV
jgi:hypothetical protein